MVTVGFQMAEKIWRGENQKNPFLEFFSVRMPQAWVNVKGHPRRPPRKFWHVKSA